MKIKLSRRFIPLLNRASRYLLLYGGAGSGKSEFCLRKVFLRCADEGDHRYLIIRKVRNSLKQSCWQAFIEFFEENGIPYKQNKTDLTIKISPPGVKPSTLIFWGLDDRLKLKSIKRITSVWIEEATELTEDDFTQIDLRLRDVVPGYRQILMSFNPDEAAGAWIRDLFFQDSMPADYSGPGVYPDSYLHHSTFLDNPIKEIRESYRAVLDALKDPTTRKIYALGQWGAIKGLFYTWPTEPLPSLDPDWYDEIVKGGDWGFSVNETAVVRVYRKGLVFWLEELLYKPGLGNKAIDEQLREIPGYDPERLEVWDSEDPKSIADIQGMGHNAVPALKPPGSVEYGIKLLQSLDIRIVEGSTNIEKERRGYKAAVDAQGRSTGKPVKFKDHFMDGSRYAITYIWIKHLAPYAQKGRAISQPAKKQIEDRLREDRSARPVSISQLRQPPSEQEEAGDKKEKEAKGRKHGTQRGRAVY